MEIVNVFAMKREDGILTQIQKSVIVMTLNAKLKPTTLNRVQETVFANATFASAITTR